MDLIRSLQPRDPALAARTASLLLAVSVPVTSVFAVIDPTYDQVPVLAFGVPSLVAGLAVAFRLMSQKWSRRLTPFVAILGILLVTGLDLVTADASAAAQVFFSVPVLYAAAQLRGGGAWATAVAAVAADALVAFRLLTFEAAVTDVVHVGATLMVITFTLVRAADRQEELVSKLDEQVSTDVLTGLRTRRRFDDAADAALRSQTGRGVVLVLLDVDSFKQVNDGWGHPVGDAALVLIADVLRRVSPASAVVGRLGGDEFAVLLPDCSASAGAELGKAVVAAVAAEELAVRDGAPVQLSVSVGTAHMPSGTTDSPADLLTLYRRADRALYAAKAARPAHHPPRLVVEAVGNPASDVPRPRAAPAHPEPACRE